MSSSQLGRGRLPRTRVLSAKPHNTDAASNAQPTIPDDRAMYQVNSVMFVLLQCRLAGWGSAAHR